MCICFSDIYIIIDKIYIIQWSLCLARTSLFTHMATDHGFNVGLPDNLGMFIVLSSIHCCDKSGRSELLIYML